MKFNQLILSIIFIALVSKTFSQTPITQSSDLNTIQNNLSTKSLEELKPIAQKLENYWYAKRGGKIIGGLHDYISQISKEGLMKFCMKIIQENEELLNFEKFKSVIEAQKISLISLGGLHDYIFRKDRDTLIKWALTADAYENSKSSSPSKISKNEKIFKMSDQDLIKFLLEKARKYKEIDNGEELEKLSESFSVNSLIENRKKIEKLKEDLSNINREKLIKFAFACEFHERKGEELLGGLHDFIRLLDDDQIRKYIIRKAKNHEDLNTLEKLEMISDIKEKLKFLYDEST